MTALLALVLVTSVWVMMSQVEEDHRASFLGESIRIVVINIADMSCSSVLRIHDDIGFDPEPAFGFGSDGGMVDLSAVRPSVGHDTPAGRAGSVLSATERVRRDQEDAARPRDVSAPSCRGWAVLMRHF